MARDPADHVVVFGVHHGQRALARGDRKHVQQLLVVQLELVVGHEDLERRDAGADQLGQVVVQRLRRGVRDDQVIAEVDDRFRRGRGGVLVRHLAQRLPAVLRGERHDGGVAAMGRGHGRAVPVVGAQHAHAGELFDVAMAVDAARHHQPAGRVDGALASGKPGREGGDDAGDDADVANEIGIRGDDAAVVQSQVEVGHGVSGRKGCLPLGA
ncbi:hypothetical protein G6F68_012268 [Rhizopus microsporus]|nr:hypothetical protein G6F68_012268 [Rhizopus microsporus]